MTIALARGIVHNWCPERPKKRACVLRSLHDKPLDGMMISLIKHVPEYLSFYLFNRSRAFPENAGMVADECNARGFGLFSGGVMVRVLSEFSEIAIQIEYQLDELDLTKEDLGKWDRVAECPLMVVDGVIYFESSTDSKPFARVSAENGQHRARIYWGGQYTGRLDGSSEDFYLIQIWPGDDEAVKYIKGPEGWPIPIQPYEEEIIRKAKAGDA
ncbi:hypothetical protein [Dyella choica]|uniref:Uncharacterized protein n=1 Tax=Dyella choica TaxID=1927959 RepID=A0A432M9P3_9GAMM|nr:hypothetical protein [Dyella choica]RUL78909.1 hypothetical protein EKH80_03660 [Dyella choica]